MLAMRRFALVMLVGLLTANFSGATEIFVDEPCSIGCCAQPVVPMPLVVVAVGLAARPEPPVLRNGLASPDPGEVLHVPRRLVRLS
jgi:hypothetical protein